MFITRTSWAPGNNFVTSKLGKTSYTIMIKVISLRNNAETVFHPLSKKDMSLGHECMSETVGTIKSYTFRIG